MYSGGSKLILYQAGHPKRYIRKKDLATNNGKTPCSHINFHTNAHIRSRLVKIRVLYNPQYRIAPHLAVSRS